MSQITLGPSRAYPNIPTVDGSPESHTSALKAVIEAINIHERRISKSQLDSFVRVRELESLGLVTITGNLVLPVTAEAAAAGATIADGTADGQLLVWDETTDQAWEPTSVFTFREDNSVGGNVYFTGNGTDFLRWAASDGGVVLVLEPRLRLDQGRLALWGTGTRNEIYTNVSVLEFTAENLAGTDGALFRYPIFQTEGGRAQPPVQPDACGVFASQYGTNFSPMLLSINEDAYTFPLENRRSVGYAYNNPTAAADPTPGFVRLNTANFATATALYFAIEGLGTNDNSWWFDIAQAGDIIFVSQGADMGRWAYYRIDSITDNTGWYTVAVTYLDSLGTIFGNGDDVLVDLIPASQFPSTGLANIVEDLTPQLGGNLDVNGYTITSDTNGDVTLDPHGSGTLNLNAGAGGVNVTTDAGNADITIDPHGTGVVNITSDVTGTGNLSMAAGSFSGGLVTQLAHVIFDSTATYGTVIYYNEGVDNYVYMEPADGSEDGLKLDNWAEISLGNFVFNTDQSVGAGQDNYVLTYDDASGQIGLEAAGGGATADYASFYQATGGITSIGATALTLNLASTQTNSDGAVFSLASNQVTVNKAADMQITMDNYINSGGTSRSEYSLWLERDSGVGFSEVAGTRHAVYARGYDSGQSASMTTIISVSDGDIFRMRIQRTDGGGTVGYQDSNGTRLTFVEV